MAKVHPNVLLSSSPAEGAAAAAAGAPPAGGEGEATSLTVWRKSLLFNCRGYTVFDARGDLAYRADSYDAEAEVVLMDPAGRPAFTVRRRRLSLSGEQWLIYAGEETRRPAYAVKRGGGGGKSVARVTPCAAVPAAAGAAALPAYEVEGSYARRRCVVYDAHQRRAVAEVQPKEAVGSDVFRLVVQPGFDVSLAMAVVVALDQLFGRPSLLRSWSSP
ncbi:Protein LURP-one-related 8 [Zea mays]|uniref:Protein LURP-one-related 8 n=1 Tax=Zea mays TaxID=4577 RepID=A0A3L6FB18_MAIZE|nr:Protein LURP-one-related 8 [Zea mays]